MATKYQVFVSSTFRYLKEHRASAMKAIVSAGHMATCLENWGLSHEDQLEVISRAVEDCQFYVIILGHTYGSIPRGKRKSYTEIELDIAEEAGIPILAMVLDESAVKTKRNSLSEEDREEKREIKNETRYQKLRDRLCKEGRWSITFRTHNDVERNIYAYFTNPPSDIRGYILETEETKSIINITTSNQVVADIVRRAGAFKTVEDRLNDAPERKRALATAFHDLHGRQLELFDKIFIESGSTLTYIAAQIAERLPKAHEVVPVKLQGQVAKPVVTTNNALAYLDLWLVHGVLCQPEPDFPPAMNEPYGAMYGPLTGISRTPNYSGRSIEDEDPDAWNAVRRIRDDFLSGTHNPDKTLVLAAASAMMLEESSPGEVYEDIVHPCVGFHVGSYENKIFKRSLYLTGVPTIVFLHDEKVDSKPNWGKCHFVFDVGLSWKTVLESYPLSIWVGCTNETASHVKETMKTQLPSSWKLRIYHSEEYPVVVAHNQVFRDKMKHANVNVYQ